MVEFGIYFFLAFVMVGILQDRARLNSRLIFMS